MFCEKETWNDEGLAMSRENKTTGLIWYTMGASKSALKELTLAGTANRN